MHSLGGTFSGHGSQHSGKGPRKWDRFIARGHDISCCKCRIGIVVLTPHWTIDLWDKSQVETSGTAPTGQESQSKVISYEGWGETNAIITARKDAGVVVLVLVPFNSSVCLTETGWSPENNS